MPFDPATIQLQRELLAKTSRDLARDERLLAKQPDGSRSKMATTLRKRIAEGQRVSGDLENLIASMEAPANEPVLDKRAQWIADARAILDLLETNPDLPLNLNSSLSISYHPLRGDDAKDMAAVAAVAEQLGVKVTPPGPGNHYEAQITIGNASYGAVAVLADYSERSAAIRRLGEAALAEQDAQAENGASR